jgi:hypothetical protein
MRFGQPLVAQDLGAKPARLASEGSLNDIARLGNQAIPLFLTLIKWFVLYSLILDAVFDAT